MLKVDLASKRLLRNTWKIIQTFLAMGSIIDKGSVAKVWYGGARTGDIGGPLVKVKRLQQFFPEKRFSYNVVYTLSNTPYLSSLALKLLKRRGVPLVLNQNGVFYSAWFEGDWREKNREMAISYHAADYVFWQSSFCKDCADQFLGKRKGAGEILFNAVNIEHYKPKYQKEKGPPTYLLTGKIDDHIFYRVEATLRGFARAQQQGLIGRLVIAGWMSEGARLNTLSLCEKLQISDTVNLIGTYSQKEAPAIYQSADVYVMLKHNDPCPNTVLEALSCGVPVLYSASGGVPELVGDLAGLGLPVAQGFDESYLPDINSIANGMIDILENLDLRKQAARQRAVEAFDLRSWVSRHEEIFGQLIHD